MRYISIAGAFVLAVVALPALAFDFSDARALVTLSQPRISPDGREVVYVRGRSDFERDKIDRQLVLVDVRSHRSRQLTWDRKGVSDPAWSPDGRAIAFSALDSDEKDPQSQIFVLPMDGGEARQVTHAKKGIISFEWSPDGKRFAYSAQDSDAKKPSDNKYLDAFEVHDNDYLHKAATPPAHLWVIRADGSGNRRLTSGSWSVATLEPDGGGEVSWSPDGTTIATPHFPTPFVGDSLSSYAVLVNAASRSIERLTPSEAMENAPAFAPRGSSIAYARNTGGDYTQGVDVYVTDSHGRRIADFRKALDRNVDGMTWNNTGDAIWVATPDRTQLALWYWRLNGTAARVNTGSVNAQNLGNVSKDGALVFVGSTNDSPTELYVLNGPSSKPAQLTNENAFAARKGIARSIAVDWRSTKGSFAEDGVLTLPLHYHGEKAPLILLIHGGPQGASTEAWSTQRQIFAAHGYFVFSPNYRGSTNLGDAYEHAITNDAGDGPGKDVMAGLARIEKLYPIDTTRVGVSGWSYGGYMTSWLIGNYPAVWKAAVSGASLDDWLDDYNIAFYYDTDVPFFHGKPWKPANTAEWREQSPITYAPRAKAPTLVMGDIGDNNVTITNSFKLYHALKDNGTQVEFVAYPVPGHFPSDPVRSEDVNKRWLAWFEKYLK